MCMSLPGSILCVFSSGVYLYFRILMYVKHHEQFEIGCGTTLNKIYYYCIISLLLYKQLTPSRCALLLIIMNRLQC